MITFNLNNEPKQLLMYHKEYLIDKQGVKYSYKLVSGIEGDIPNSLRIILKDWGFFESYLGNAFLKD